MKKIVPVLIVSILLIQCKNQTSKNKGVEESSFDASSKIIVSSSENLTDVSKPEGVKKSSFTPSVSEIELAAKDEFVLKTNYFDLPKESKQKLEKILGTQELNVLGNLGFEKLQDYFNNSVIKNNKDCPFGGAYGVDPSTAYFWFVYNSLPEFVNEQERHRGYYKGESNQSYANKLLAYAIYRIDRSSTNLRALFEYMKPTLKTVLPEADYQRKYASKVNALITNYDYIVKVENYRDSLLQTYQMLDTLSGRIEYDYEIGKENYSAELGAYGFSNYDLEGYIARHLKISGDELHFMDVLYFSFWMRRCGEGNMDEVYAILNEVKKIYNN